MTRPQRVIGAVAFSEDGSVMINYMDVATDVRNRELLVMQHQLVIQPGDGGKDYGDEIEDARAACDRLLNDALEDWNAPPEEIRA